MRDLGFFASLTQRLIDICDDVGNRFNPHRNSYQSVSDAELPPASRSYLAVRRSGRMQYLSKDIAETGSPHT